MLSEEKQLYFYELFLKGIPVKKGVLNELADAGFDVGIVKPKVHKEPQSKKRADKKYNIKPKRDYTVKTDKEIKVDSEIDVVVTEEPITSEKIDVVETLVRKSGNVTEKDWRPESIIYHTKEFYAWIDSINSGFLNRIEYEPFNLYVQQADDWLAENNFITNYNTSEEQMEFALTEFFRCNQNKLYACDKYGWLSDPSEPSGRRKYVASDDYIHHRILLFLFDCGYSIILGKPRQVGCSSIIGMAANFEMILKKNNFTKFISEDKDTGTEIFNDKILYAYSQLPTWFKPMILNDRDNLFRISQSNKNNNKKDKRGASSKIQVVAPTKTAINGGSPQRTIVDEIGSISILGEMIGEARPTLFVKDSITKKIYQRRCVWMLGTGTSDKGGVAFEKEWNRIMGLWLLREPQVGVVPLFFDYHTRCDDDFYFDEKKYYYTARAKAESIDVETSKIQFHQHYPTYASDMFVQTGKTLISRDAIHRHIERINKNLQKIEYEIEYGYFEPIFDTNVKVENQDLPFKIIGAEFVKSGYGDEKFSTIIFEKPNPTWKDRYYAGTDPISSDTGTSKMSTTIWDELRHTPCCLVNVREPNNPNYSFLQCMLATIYYDTQNKIGIPEVVERNIGLAYKNYRETKGYINSLMINSEIDMYFQSGNAYDVGIDNKGNRTRQIINKMGECLNLFGENIYIETYFNQLMTFTCTIGRSGTEIWGSIDKRYYMDDTLYSLVYAFIAAQSSRRQPVDMKEVQSTHKTVEYELAYDKDWNIYQKAIVKNK